MGSEMCIRDRETIASVLRPWFLARDLATLELVLNDAKVLWSPYRDVAEVAAAARSGDHEIVSEIDQPGVGAMLAASAPWRWDGKQCSARPAPLLSADTHQVLSEVLGLTETDIGGLQARGVV